MTRIFVIDALLGILAVGAHALDDAARPDGAGVDVEVVQRLAASERELLSLYHRAVFLEDARVRFAELVRERLVAQAIVAKERPEVHRRAFRLRRYGVQHAPRYPLAAIALRRAGAGERDADVEHDGARRLEADDLPAVDVAGLLQLDAPERRRIDVVHPARDGDRVLVVRGRGRR